MSRNGLSRSIVVDTAIQCVDTEGPGALGVNRVARALSVRPPSLYHYVDGNDDLRLAVALEAWRRLVATVEASVLGELPPHGASGSPEVAVARVLPLLSAYRDFLEHHPSLHQVMSVTDIPVGEPTFLDTKRRLYKAFSSALSPLEMPHDTFIHFMRTVRSAVHGFLVLRDAHQFQFEVDQEESLKWLLGALAQGLVAQLRSAAEA